MTEDIFSNVDDNDFNWVVKCFYNSIHVAEKFRWALPFIISRIGCGVEDSFCIFPDLNSFDPEMHFEGICFGFYDGEVTVSDKIGFEVTKDACYRYIALYPKEKNEIMKYINEIEKMGF